LGCTMGNKEKNDGCWGGGIYGAWVGVARRWKIGVGGVTLGEGGGECGALERRWRGGVQGRGKTTGQNGLSNENQVKPDGSNEGHHMESVGGEKGRGWGLQAWGGGRGGRGLRGGG